MTAIQMVAKQRDESFEAAQSCSSCVYSAFDDQKKLICMVAGWTLRKVVANDDCCDHFEEPEDECPSN